MNTGLQQERAQTESAHADSVQRVVRPAIDVINSKMLDGKHAARIVGSDTFYWRISRIRTSERLYLEQEIETRTRREGEKGWKPGRTRTVKNSIRPETLLEIVPMTELEFHYEDGGWRRTWKLKLA